MVSIGPKRMWNLTLAFEYLGGTRRMVSSDTIRRMLGHAIFVCPSSDPCTTLRREASPNCSCGRVLGGSAESSLGYFLCPLET